MKPLRFFLVGCGRISHRHIRAIRENREQAELVGVSDARIGHAKALQEECRALGMAPPRLFDAFDPAMLRATRSDVCVIAAPSGLHAQMALRALRTGCSVLVEKPMALSTQEAEQMIKEAEGRGLTLGVCHQNRFNPPVAAAYQAVQQGEFGPLFHLDGAVWWNRQDAYYDKDAWRGTLRMDGGVLMNQGIHMADLLNWFAGSPVQWIEGMTHRYDRPIEAEDFGAALLRFADGKIAVFSATALAYPQNLSETLSVFGSSGCAVLGGTAVNRVCVWNSKSAGACPGEKKPAGEPDRAAYIYGSGHTPLYRDFIRAVREGGRPLVDGQAGFSAMQVILGIYRSQQENRPVFVPTLRFSTAAMKAAE